MKFQAHRGVSTEFPENTMSAFKAAFVQKYDIIETDPAVTADGEIVILHDKTPARTCIGELTDRNVRELTYAELSLMDAGIKKAPKFKGEHIPLFSELLEFAAGCGIAVKIDNKAERFSEEALEKLFDMVEKSYAKASFTCATVDFAKKVADRFENPYIHYDGPVTEDVLKELSKFVPKERLAVWLPIKSRLTEWVKVRRADKELCDMVKKYAELGMWILSDLSEIEEAERLGADIIETTGSLKPPNYDVGCADCHCHIRFSHDSECDEEELVKKAVENGFGAVAITDHCDVQYADTLDLEGLIGGSVKASLEMKDKYRKDIRVLCGVEIGEGLWNPEITERILALADYDIILSSVHAVRYEGYTRPFSGINFTEMTEKQISEYIKVYFEDMLELVQNCDLDVLPHLTRPTGYICGKYGIKFSLEPYKDQIDAILKEMIKRHIALEINTAPVGGIVGLTPGEDVIARYRDLGGYLITLGSDCHRAEHTGVYFEKALETVRRLGFPDLYYYENRIPIPYRIIP